MRFGNRCAVTSTEKGALRSFLVALTLTMAGCSSLPSLGMQPSRLDLREETKSQAPPSLKDLINHLQCEVALAISHLDASRRAGAVNPVPPRRFVVVMDLTAEVKETTGIAPSLSLIHPIVAGSTDRSLLFNGEYTAENHNNVNRNFKFSVDSDSMNNISPLKSDSAPKDCGKGSGLGGDLNLMQSIGLVWDHAYDLPILEPAAGEEKTDDGPTFTISVDFSITKAANGGPNWNLERVNGPDSAGSGLLRWNRNAKDAVILAFSEVVVDQPITLHDYKLLPPAQKTQRDVEEKAARKRAERAAEDALTRSLLRRILPNR